MRGEHWATSRFLARDPGSSPRARGALHVPRADLRSAGIIPACAGSTNARTGHRWCARDHPRVRGEHCADGSIPAVSRGSSPRARGARRGDAVLGGERGIIPACAGSTLPVHRATSTPGDHPRVRGEHGNANPLETGRQGSSPRARGAQPPPLGDGHGLGIIPACAGSTSSRPCRSSWRRDHPRVRGEHPTATPSMTGTWGSSPRARGAPRMPAEPVVDEGIIPACAGSTTPGRQPGRPGWDHPRVRGEHRDGEATAKV